MPTATCVSTAQCAALFNIRISILPLCQACTGIQCHRHLGDSRATHLLRESPTFKLPRWRECHTDSHVMSTITPTASQQCSMQPPSTHALPPSLLSPHSVSLAWVTAEATDLPHTQIRTWTPMCLPTQAHELVTVRLILAYSTQQGLLAGFPDVFLMLCNNTL